MASTGPAGMAIWPGECGFRLLAVSDSETVGFLWRVGSIGCYSYEVPFKGSSGVLQ